MTIYMYYETDGDSGYYSIRLFTTEQKALNYKEKMKSAYGHIKEMKVE